MPCRVLDTSCSFLGSSPTEAGEHLPFSLQWESDGTGTEMSVTTYKPGLYFWHPGLVSTTKIAISPITEFCYLPVITSSAPCPGGSLNAFGNALSPGLQRIEEIFPLSLKEKQTINVSHTFPGLNAVSIYFCISSEWEV